MAAARPPPPPANPPAPPPAPLGHLLDRLERAHKADVQELTGGHLNESRLYRHPEPPRRSHLLERGDRGGSRGATAAEFAAEPRVPVRRVRLLPAPARPPPRVAAATGKPALHREALVEELLQPVPPSPRRLLAPAAGEGSHAGNFRRAQLVRKRLVREQDTLEQDLMSGYAAVRDLEVRLQENLRQHFSGSSGPSFHRLQLYSAALDEIVKQSVTFGSLLEAIKVSYDEYLAWLLDTTAPAQHRHLRAQLAQLRDPRAEAELERARGRLDELEAAAEAALAGLADSRRRLAEAEAADAAAEAAEASAAAQLALLPPPIAEMTKAAEAESSGDRCERLLREVWASLDAAAALRRELRANRSPLVCAAHLERCCRLAQGEMQAVEEELARVSGANRAAVDQLLASLAAADGDHLDGAGELDADSDAADERRRVVRLFGSECAASTLASAGLDLPADLLAAAGAGGCGAAGGDDPRKWNWYIS